MGMLLGGVKDYFVGGAIALAGAGAYCTNLESVDVITNISRVTHTSEPYYKTHGIKVQTRSGPYYKQDFFIPQISLIPLSIELRGEPVKQGDALHATFYVNDQKEIVGWNGSVIK